jgi:MATE family multidrug resistance protein
MTTPLESPVREQSQGEVTARQLGDRLMDERSAGRGGPAPGGLREVSVLAYPVILTQLSMTTMGVVDSAMVGRLGATELAAVGFGGVWMWTTFCAFVGASTGVQTFVAQHHGAGELKQCGAWTWQGAWLLVPLCAVAAALLITFIDPLLAFLAPSPALQPLAASYMSVRAIGSVGLCLATIFAAFFRGIGDTRTPLYVTLLANGVNVVLDYGLIFGRFGLPEWGIAGAATATAVAEWMQAGVLMAFLLRAGVRERFSTSPVRPDATAQRRLLRLGLPIGGQWVLEMASFALFLTMVARMGDASMAASQAFIALLSMSFMQAVGIGIAVSTLVGQYIGARDLASAARSFASAQKLTAVLSGTIALLFVLVPDRLIGIFTSDPDVLALGRPLLLVGAVFQLFDAFGIVTDGALRGAGDTRVPFLVRFCLAWGLFVPLAWWLGIHLEGGLTAAWVGGALYVLVLTSYLLARFRSGAWQRIQI